MANANANRPGRADMERVRPEQNIPKGTKLVEVNGTQYLQTEMTNGNVRNTRVFPGDYTKEGKKSKKASK